MSVDPSSDDIKVRKRSGCSKRSAKGLVAMGVVLSGYLSLGREIRREIPIVIFHVMTSSISLQFELIVLELHAFFIRKLVEFLVLDFFFNF